MHAGAHTCTDARTLTRANARIHTHTHAPPLLPVHIKCTHTHTQKGPLEAQPLQRPVESWWGWLDVVSHGYCCCSESGRWSRTERVRRATEVQVHLLNTQLRIQYIIKLVKCTKGERRPLPKGWCVDVFILYGSFDLVIWVYDCIMSIMPTVYWHSRIWA